MFRKKVKKAFTLVELLVVIAILAILATVSVVGYTQFTKRAQQSNDMSLTTQINTVLQADEVTGKPEYPTQAMAVMEEAGANIAELSPTTEGYSYVYNLKTNRVILFDGDKNVVAPEDTTISDADKAYCYAMVHSEEEKVEWVNAGYSVYLSSEFTGNTVEVNKAVGVDVGESNVTSVSITGTEANTATIYTNGGSVAIDAANATINHYGMANNVTVTAVDQTNSYHLYGTVELEITVKVGHIVIEAGASASAVLVDGNNVSIKVENNATLNSVGATSADYDVEIDSNVSYDVTVSDTTGLLLFAGGCGTEENPYLIENVEQFGNINDLDAEMLDGQSFYFKQIADITVNMRNPSSALVMYFRGVYDGGNYSVAVADESVAGTLILFWYPLGDVTIKNITTISNSKVGVSIIYLSLYTKELTISGITAESKNNETVKLNAGNFGFIVYYSLWDERSSDVNVEADMEGKQVVCIENCTVNASIENTGNCASPFIGQGLFPTENQGFDLTIRNCVNNGNVTSSLTAGLLSGNGTYYNDVALLYSDDATDEEKIAALNEAIHIENVVNNGTITAPRAYIVARASDEAGFINEYYATLIEGTGKLVALNNVIANEAINVYYMNGNYYVDNSNYEYKLVFKVSAISFPEGESNSRDVLIDVTALDDASLGDSYKLQTGKVYAYDSITALEKGVLTADEIAGLDYKYNCESYQVALITKGENTYVIFKAEKSLEEGGFEVDSSITTYVYGYDEDGTYLGNKRINQ